MSECTPAKLFRFLNPTQTLLLGAGYHYRKHLAVERPYAAEVMEHDIVTALSKVI